MRSSIVCRACGFPSPLDGLVVSDEVDCAQCGAIQRFDPVAWRAGVAFAHAVGDLGGPGAEGRAPSDDLWIGELNPYASLGVTATFATQVAGGLSVEACPGYPVCRRCNVALEVRGDASGCEARCPGCGVIARYALPREVSALSTAVRAAVTSDQQVDRREANVDTSGGLSALTCPQCGAALTSIGRTAECAYCGTRSFVPPQARPRGAGHVAPPIVFFLAFDARSPERIELERPTKKSGVEKKGFMLTRGLNPLDGIELAPRRTGLDVKQLALTVTLALLALAIGFVVHSAIFAPGALG